MLRPDLYVTLERAELVLRLRDGREHSRLMVAHLDAVEHLALIESGTPPALCGWGLADLDAALERGMWERVGHWLIDAAGRTTARVSTATGPGRG